MNHIMIDNETAGNKPGSVILTIGAIKFDPSNIDLEHATPDNLDPDRVFYRRIDRKSCFDLGLTQEVDTLNWWSEQNQEARFEAFDAEPRQSIQSVMADFSQWCGDKPKVWSHGATYDIVHLEAIFQILDILPPWKFWDIRDTRTLYDYTGMKPVRDKNHHHALWDSIAQAKTVQEAYSLKQPSFQVAEAS